MSKTVLITLAVIAVCFPHVVLIVMAVKSARRKRQIIIRQPVTREERVLFGSRQQ